MRENANAKTPRRQGRRRKNSKEFFPCLSLRLGVLAFIFAYENRVIPLAITPQPTSRCVQIAFPPGPPILADRHERQTARSPGAVPAPAQRNPTGHRSGVRRAGADPRAGGRAV